MAGGIDRFRFRREDEPLRSYARRVAEDDADDALSTANEAKKEARELRAALEAATKDLDKTKQEISALRNKNLETLAIFVALFTFASLSFQMFANVDSAFWVPLSFVLGGALLLFCAVVLVAGILQSDTKWRKGGIVACIVAALILLTWGGVLYGSALNKKDMQESNCAIRAQKLVNDEYQDRVGSLEIYKQLCANDEERPPKK